MAGKKDKQSTDKRGLGSHLNEEPFVDIGDDEEQPSAVELFLRRMRDKFRLGKHFKMERFVLFFGLAVLMLLSSTGLAFKNYRADVTNLVSSQALLSENVRFSLSNQEMEPIGVYGDKERKDVMVLLRMADVKSMSLDANNYQLFIKGQSSKLKRSPKVSFSIFGTTGYVLIRFQDDKPLPKQVLAVTIRANEELSERTGSGEGYDKYDDSYSEFDQGLLFVNPGAELVTEVDSLALGETNPEKLYMSLVADAKDVEIREEVNTLTKSLNSLMLRSKEYTNRLIATGFIPPETPWFIDGDYVDEDGVFRPARDVSRAHVFDYYTKDIHDGYLNQIMKDPSEIDTYMNRTFEEFVSSSTINEEDEVESVNETELLKRKDGSSLALDKVSPDASSMSDVTTLETVRTLESTWSTYLDEKRRLQREVLRKFIVLDSDVRSQSTGYSINNQEDSVFLY